MSKHLIHLVPVLLLLVPSCTLFKKSEPPPMVETAKPNVLWEWDDNAAAKAVGPLSIQVHLDDQKARVYRGDTQIAWSYIASGISKYPTPKGSFKILEKTADKFSNLYGKLYDKDGKCINEDAKMGRDPVPEGGKFVGARMAYWMRCTFDGIGLHVGPIPHPGRRASHGCIRMPRAAAAKFFANVKLGTPVTIIDKKGDTPPKYYSPKPTPSPATKVTPKPAAEEVFEIRKPEVRPPVENTPPGLPLPANPEAAPPPAKPAGT
jgi:hypothetical protein